MPSVFAFGRRFRWRLQLSCANRRPRVPRGSGELRSFVERFPRQAALKRLLALQGVPVTEAVRAPLRTLTTAERDELDAWAATSLVAA